MEVQLYVYDLTKGMARQMSQQFLGIQIDAVYHTAVVLNDVEFFFGAGVQTCNPGTTHHGRPMEIISMGKTELPFETVLDYLESLKEVYTPESYDLFAHNCNNFSHDFVQFLVGKPIPDHITSLPKRVLDTPFGQMLRPQIDASMRSITQAEVPTQNRPQAMNPSSTPQPASRYGQVVDLTDSNDLDKQLTAATDTCVTLFFTSSTCAPCKLAYPMFDQLAGTHPNALFVKVDINEARDIASRYQIRATPTFMTLSKGNKVDEWSGADPNMLKANVELLVQQTFPPHPHLNMAVPSLQYGSMKNVIYSKLPPLDKLMAKLGDAANEEDIVNLRAFVKKRAESPRDAPLPDLHLVAKASRSKILALPVETRFAAVDLLRCAMVDPRVGGFFAEEREPKTVPLLIRHISKLDNCPHNLRLVTIHLACNTFASSLYIKELMASEDDTLAQLIELITTSLLDASHPTTRVAAASLAFNLSIANYKVRREEGQEALAEGEQVELAASLLETLSEEESPDAAKLLLLALGFLAYCSPVKGELVDLLKVMDAKQTVTSGKCKSLQSLAKEVASVL
ncbi:related to thioredoxin [Ramularia collo-cygni]|uniref:Related to thioredoxin n=1 Tax=Ramularia collo-cygni TaxID=112498 RepID=A0A2D3V2Q0_9PEZI|nr:related to thioredoxin [Ramularia collo-cygni]CZT18957.1 related to thioredoxin [Ramularia collo-cygni]